jgi:ElaB/YqjD/DUF883 family membrane-anchored ribosome-binding protein
MLNLDIGSRAEALASAAVQRAKHCVDSGVDACTAVSEKARQVGRETDRYVHANPWLIIGAAAGVGLLVGLMIRRR